MEISSCSQSVWDNFVLESNEGSIFSQSDFLNCYKKDVDYLISKKGGTITGGIALLKTDENGVYRAPYHAYGGLLYSNSDNLKTYKKISQQFQVQELFAEYLFNKYEHVHISNHWNLKDIRAFDWFNYHCKEQGHYKITTRYTSLLKLENNIEDGFSRSRRQMIKNGRKHGVTTIAESDVDILDSLHTQTFERQGLSRTEDEARAMKSIVTNLSKKDLGKLFISRVNDEVASASFFLIDRNKKIGHYLFGANNPNLRDFNPGSTNILDSIKNLQQHEDLNFIDFVGINSPQRGYFKLTFGGEIIPYYEVHL